MYSAPTLPSMSPCLSTDIQRHPPVYLKILGIAVNKATTITVITSIATTFLVFAVNQAPNFAVQLITCPLSEGCW